MLFYAVVSPDLLVFSDCKAVTGHLNAAEDVIVIYYSRRRSH
jgi:hypothetical protein